MSDIQQSRREAAARRRRQQSSRGRQSVVVTGSSGLVGSQLCEALEAAGHGLGRMVRGRPSRTDSEISWDPLRGSIEYESLEGTDVVIHLAGAGIADARWSHARKDVLRTSRVPATELLATTLAGLTRPPRVLISASAVGFYGDRRDAFLDDESPCGEGFLAELCRDWEEATRPASRAGIRVVRLRIGVVLSRKGGALGKMLPAFRLGLGGRLGTGRQWMSWIGVSDLVAAIQHLMLSDEVEGAVNAVSPQPVRNEEFTHELSRALKRPTAFALPAWLLKFGLGELAEEALLAGARVMPERLLASGFSFDTPGLREALAAALA